MKASENPFRSEAVAKLRYRITPTALESLAERALTVRGLWSLLGPQGTGKTTLLEDLEAILKKQGIYPKWMQLTEESMHREHSAAIKCFAEGKPNDIFFFDGGEVLGPVHWWRLKRLTRQRGFCMITTLHRPRGTKVLYETTPDWPKTLSLVQSLSNENLKTVAEDAFIKSDGNVREVFAACYWACARLP